MALTENETKRIGLLRNSISNDEWDNLSSSDEFAREIIAKYLPNVIINKQGTISNLQTAIDREQAELNILTQE